ncbi:MAG: methylmalonyl-CoA mutase family protein, partial [Bacteroidota bacterium]|nr:methylmalonyl-CoA mutase family protein [Bacteroidota bacterium]
ISLSKLGVNELGFIFHEKSPGFKIVELFEDLDFSALRLNLSAGASSLDLLTMLVEWLQATNINKDSFSGGIEYNPLGSLVLSDKFYSSEADDMKQAYKLIKLRLGNAPNIKVLSLSGDIFSNLGCTIVEELGFSLAMASEYIAQISKMGINPSDIANSMQLNLGIGPNYFFEIAKIRSARWLWSVLAKAYEAKDAGKIFIQSVPTSFNKTRFDPYVNMLRYTTEALSAAIGGANSINIFPFNSIEKQAGDFSERIARNTQIILKEESYINKINDPAAGSYYIENLTNSIAERSWELFQNIESQGGFLKAYKKGIIQEQIEKSRKIRQGNISGRKEILVGTNHYPNLIETSSGPEKHDGTQKGKPGTENSKKFMEKRGAYEFEKLREAVNLSGNKLAILFPFGNPATRSARTTFASGFIGCSGFEIKDLTGIKNIEEGIKICSKLKPELIVLCSSDEEYPLLVPKIIEKVQPGPVFVIAGNPTDSKDKLNSLGIHHFIHTKSNIFETLSQILMDAGVHLPG